MEAEVINRLREGIYFDEFLRGPEVAYGVYISKYLMPGRPPVFVETMRRRAYPGDMLLL